jgi:hypothetical protein
MRQMVWLVAMGLIIAGALVHGASTQRWQLPQVQASRVERLHALEIRFGDWQPTPLTTEQLPPHERSRATVRHYAPRQGPPGAIVTLISGPPGAVTIHTPDVCYPASGYRLLRGPTRETLPLPDGAVAQYYVADFEKRSATQLERVRVRWSWSDQGTWQAPEWPRWQFARRLQLAPVLYKLYIATPLGETADAPQTADDELVREFLRAVFAQYAAALAHP